MAPSEVPQLSRKRLFSTSLISRPQIQNLRCLNQPSKHTSSFIIILQLRRPIELKFSLLFYAYVEIDQVRTLVFDNYQQCPLSLTTISAQSVLPSTLNPGWGRELQMGGASILACLAGIIELLGPHKDESNERPNSLYSFSCSINRLLGGNGSCVCIINHSLFVFYKWCKFMMSQNMKLYYSKYM